MIPPFLGSKITEFPTKELFALLSKKVLFEGRWGFSKGRLTDAEYDKIIETKAKPALEKLICQETETPVIECKAVYGFYKCHSDCESIIVDSWKEPVELSFPRKKTAGSLGNNRATCISDFVEKSDDYIAFFAVTIGSKIIATEKKLFDEGSYFDYHLLHGLGAELADCGAVAAHRRICEELSGKKLELGEKAFGCRYSFGYPACPDLSYQKHLFNILEPSRIGLSLTESWQMVPELSVSGFILFNPNACYIVP